MKLGITYNNFRCFIYKFFLSECKNLNFKPLIPYPVLFLGSGKISIGKSQLGIHPSPYFLNSHGYIEARNSCANITIGQSTFINNNFVIIADNTTITIGDNCLIGPNCFISDSDFHGLKVEDRQNGNYTCSPVNIEDNVFIGENCRILKGVTIGHGSIIGNSSLVLKDVPPNTIYGGVPAKFIKNIPL